MTRCREVYIATWAFWLDMAKKALKSGDHKLSIEYVERAVMWKRKTDVFDLLEEISDRCWRKK